jgi:hypothetical protein
MKRQMLLLRIPILLFPFMWLTGFIWQADAPAPFTKKAQQTELQLFNGKNLEGWYTFLKDRGRNHDPNKVFTVSNGWLRISGEEFGCLTTLEEFENYKLTVTFKWGETTFSPRVNNARDSGILLHSVGEDGGSGGIWMHSLECQIIEGGTGDFIVVGDGSTDFSMTCPVAQDQQEGSYVYQPSGNRVTLHEGRINWFGRDPAWEDVKGFRGAGDIENPVGKWNTIQCVVKGKEIIVYLNGILVNHAFDVKPHRGRIQIQSEGAEIFFRRISLEPL